MSFQSNAIFWVEVHKIKPNPYQPRRDFDEGKLRDLADSIRQYGVLQPLVVTRKEVYTEDGGMVTEYELIAGERRLRAARIASVSQVPVVIRSDEEDENVKLELAIIENIQREDLNPIDRARAFARLADEFGYKHGEIGKKMGKSRVWVSNTLRILSLPEEMVAAIADGRLREGHSRPLLMLADKPEEQQVLFREILQKSINVREAEQLSRRLSPDRVRNDHITLSPEVKEFEKEMGEKLGTQVSVFQKPGTDGGRVVINFSSSDDLVHLMEEIRARLLEEERQAAEETQISDSADSEPLEPEPEPQRKDEREDDSIYSLDNFSL